MVVDLEKRQKIAGEQEKITSEEAKESQKLFSAVSVIKADCEEQLELAMPLYRGALAALDTLDKNDITEMKAYTSPAEEIVLVI